MNYHIYLSRERSLRGVTAGTRSNRHDLLRLAAKVLLPLQMRLQMPLQTTVFPLEKANQALQALKQAAINGAAVLRLGDSL